VREVTDLGLIGELTRVVGWRGYLAAFGGLLEGTYTPYAVRGYFNNGGEVAWVCRLCAPGVAVAKGTLVISDDISGQGFAAKEYQIEASSPGAWAEGGTVNCRYRRSGLSGQPELEVVIRMADEPVEFLAGIALADLVKAVNEGSNLIRIAPLGSTPVSNPNHAGPIALDLPTVTLSGGSDGFDPQITADAAALRIQYQQRLLSAVQALNDEEEVALIAAPDLQTDPWLRAQERDAAVTEMLRQAAALHDRLVLLDSPTAAPSVEALLEQADHYRDLADQVPPVERAGAFYHPWLQIPLDPKVHPKHPSLQLPPSGHVAGVISRLDRERGAHHTPANAPVIEAVDLSSRLEDAEQALLHPMGVNLVRCFPGRGLQVWGSRTLDLGDPLDLKNGRFVAHRRLVHRLVRAARRVAEPLVFDVNGPELWLTLVRALTSVLLEAFRSGALQGGRPEEAFYVKCDAQNNPPEETDAGRCLCEIGIAPARPMEFIVLKVALLANGTLEVVE
jgi:phage tail sheath protein FI